MTALPCRSALLHVAHFVIDGAVRGAWVRGPLNIARPVQGWPVIVQTGASEPGRQLAAGDREDQWNSPRRQFRNAHGKHRRATAPETTKFAFSD